MINDHLAPKSEDVLQAELAAGGAIGEVMAQANFDARRTMNAMKTVGSALRHAMLQDDSSEHFSFLLEEAQRVARILLLKWGKNPEDRANKWMVNVVEKSVMPFLGPESLSEKKIDELASALVDRSFDWPEDPAFKESAQVDFALFRGINRLQKEIEGYNFHRKNKDADLDLLCEKVIAGAEQTMEEICPPLADPASRVTFMTMILDELFECMALSWQKNAQRARQALASQTQAQVKNWKAANPEGFSLDPVISHFEQNVGRLSRLTTAARKKDRR